MVAENFMKLTFSANVKQRTVSDMTRYIDADMFIERIEASPAFPNMGMDGEFLREVVINLINNAPASDVIEVNDDHHKQVACYTLGCREADKIRLQILRRLRREIHDKAVFPYARGIDPFISIKVVDAIIGNYLRELEGKRSSE